MNEREQLCDFFRRFYEIVARPFLRHTVADSEWAHFSSMITASNYEPERIQFYLRMLEHEKKLKKADGRISAPSFLEGEMSMRTHTLPTIDYAFTDSLLHSRENIATKSSEQCFQKTMKIVGHQRAESQKTTYTGFREPLGCLLMEENRLSTTGAGSLRNTNRNKEGTAPTNKKLQGMLANLLKEF